VAPCYDDTPTHPYRRGEVDKWDIKDPQEVETVLIDVEDRKLIVRELRTIICPFLQAHHDDLQVLCFKPRVSLALGIKALMINSLSKVQIDYSNPMVPPNSALVQIALLQPDFSVWKVVDHHKLFLLLIVVHCRDHLLASEALRHLVLIFYYLDGSLTGAWVGDYWAGGRMAWLLILGLVERWAKQIPALHLHACLLFILLVPLPLWVRDPQLEASIVEVELWLMKSVIRLEACLHFFSVLEEIRRVSLLIWLVLFSLS
jgi:hypothetical protein